MAIDRTPRDSQTREVEVRRKPWTPPGAFPMDLNTDPNKRYRWVRTHHNSIEEDKSNLYKRMQSGWRPVTADEMPQLSYLKGSLSGNIELSGTVLCTNSVENTQQAVDYYSKQAEGQLDGAAAEFESGAGDSRMPKFSEGNLRSRIIRNS